MNTRCAKYAAALLIAAGVGAFAPADAAYAACLNGAESRRAIAAGEARPLNAVLRRERLNGEVVRAELCEGGGRRLVWQVSWLTANGKLVNKTLPAN